MGQRIALSLVAAPPRRPSWPTGFTTAYIRCRSQAIVEALCGGDLQPDVYTRILLPAPRASLQGIRDNVVQVAHHAAISVRVGEAGRVPVNITSSEIYTGLERGTLDRADNAANHLIDSSLFVVAPHTATLATGMYWSGPQRGYNPGLWSGLGDERRATLMEASASGMARLIINHTDLGRQRPAQGRRAGDEHLRARGGPE